jgi:uncharacterized protein (DUF1499 family)
MRVMGWIPAILGVLSLTLLALGFAAGVGRVTPAMTAFSLASLGMLIGVIATVCGLVMVVRGGMNAKSAMALCGLPGAMVLIYSVVGSLGKPPINDITTNRVYPPAFTNAQKLPENAQRDMTYPESFKAQVDKAYPDLQSLGLTQKRDDVFAKATSIAKSEGWTITASTVDAKESAIEGYATTKLFGFKDDFVIRITDADSGGVVVDMRSKSRDGKGDLGANAARIRDFFAKLKG